MSIKIVLPLAMFVSPALAVAQTPADPDKSAQQITCELTGECVAPVEPATSELRNKPDSRGFKVARKSDPKKPEPGYTPKRGEKKASIPAGKAGKGPQLAQEVAKSPAKANAGKATGGASRLAVGFELNSATLDAAGLRQAKELLAALKGPKLAGKRIVVSGHTDSLGTRQDNLALSLRRAQTLVDYLAQNGIDRSTLEAKGIGFDRPLPGLSPRATANRRVEVALAG